MLHVSQSESRLAKFLERRRNLDRRTSSEVRWWIDESRRNDDSTLKKVDSKVVGQVKDELKMPFQSNKDENLAFKNYNIFVSMLFIILTSADL
jgi:hypothetical protein